MQYGVNDKIKAAFQGKTSPHNQRIFWNLASMRLTLGIIQDLDDLSILLEVNTPHSWAWCRPIGLIIPHPIQFTFLSNASYEGLGGWSPQFGIMWCITKAKFCTLGFLMVVLSEPLAHTTKTIHINLLEFVALCINIWHALAFCLKDDPTCQHHHIGNFLADNTSVLSWMVHAGWVHMPPSHHLTCFLQILLTFSPVQFQFQSHHISSKSNDTANLLSWPLHAESWVSVIATWPMDLHTCKPYLVLCNLLCMLHDCIVVNGTRPCPSQE